MPAEVWKPVPGYEGQYEVSDQGRVRSLDRVCLGKDGKREIHHGKILKPQKMKRGYLEVSISSSGRRTHRTIHTLVAEVFLGPRPEGFDVAHRDGDRSHNTVNNLFYATREDNLHSTYSYGGKQANGKLSLADVDEIRRRLASGDKPTDIAHDFNVNSAAIYHIKNGTTFKWYPEKESI